MVWLAQLSVKSDESTIIHVWVYLMGDNPRFIELDDGKIDRNKTNPICDGKNHGFP